MNKFICLLALVVIVASDPLRFDGQKVLRVYAENNAELNLLQKTIGDEADIWSRESTLGIGANDIRMDSEMEASVRNLGFKVESFIEDLQGLIDTEASESSIHKMDDSWFTAYHTYDEIVAYLEELADTYPTLCVLNASIGQSIQGRDIPALTITASTDPTRQRLWFNGGQHAREWVGPATVLYLATQLLEQYGTNKLITTLINTVEFDIVPLVNPDGYVYAWTTNRLWRKNRRNNGNNVFGVDLNRNWNEHWGGAGSSKTPSSDTYCGKGPFSEPESFALSSYISSLPNVIGAIDFHSYSQLVLRPYGWTTTNCPDEQSLKIIGEGVSYTIYEINGMDYSSIKSIELYATTGSSTDWWYQEGIWASYCIELRDTGRYGFVLPPDQIIPTGQEIWNSMEYFWQTVVDSYPGNN